MEFYKETCFKTTKIGEIPSEWHIALLKDFCTEITDGSHFSPREDKNGDYRIATVTNIKNDKIDLSSCKRISKDEYEKLVKNGCRPNKGDILFSKDGTVGLSFSYKQDVDIVLLSSIAIIRPKKELYSDYCAYILTLERVFQQIVGSKRGTGLSRIILKDLKRIQIPIPKKIEEQKQIAAILSRVDDTIQKTNEIIQKTQLLKKGLMQELLTKGIGHKEFKYSEELRCEIPKEWNVKTIAQLFDVKTGTTPSTRKEKYWKDGSINWLTPDDLSKLNGRIYINNGKRKITEIALKEYNLNLMAPKSIIISTRAPVGYVAILLEKATFNQGCKGLIPKDPNITSSEFYSYFLINKRDMLNIKSGGSTFKELSKKMLEDFFVPVPKFEEQHKIASILSKVDDQIEKERRTKEQLERLKKGLMQILLTGKVRVKVN